MEKKIDLMHKQFGTCQGHTCKECSNFVRGRYHDMMLRKCQVYGLTHSEASDWAGKWAACGMFNREYSGRPIIELRRGVPKPPPEPVEGQITLGGLCGTGGPGEGGTMGKTMDLCRPCACAIEDEGEYHCHPIKGGVDNKVVCEKCGRRRYGMTYRLEEKSKSNP